MDPKETTWELSADQLKLFMQYNIPIPPRMRDIVWLLTELDRASRTNQRRV